jgi:4-hydroxybenzoyl-CoA thioesterase
MIYRRTIQVEFNHCDPAGIVFYPRYFEMTNSVVENFFADVAQCSFAQMMQTQSGVPTARIEADFRAPSRLGDKLDWALIVTHLGKSSIVFRLTAVCQGAHRLTADLTLVRVGAEGRPVAWTGDIRARLAGFVEGME